MYINSQEHTAASYSAVQKKLASKSKSSKVSSQDSNRTDFATQVELSPQIAQLNDFDKADSLIFCGAWFVATVKWRICHSPLDLSWFTTLLRSGHNKQILQFLIYFKLKVQS